MTDDKTRRHFANMLTYYLAANNLTQADLARHMEVSTATTAKWATGQSIPRMDKIQSICNYLGVSKSDLLEDKAPKEEDELLMQRLINAASGCTPEQINTVIAMLESFKRR